MFIERLIHNTKSNAAKYDFDKKYYKLPCYMLRDIEAQAYGYYSSYVSNLANYEKGRYESISNGLKFKKGSLEKQPAMLCQHFIRIICIWKKRTIKLN